MKNLSIIMSLCLAACLLLLSGCATTVSNEMSEQFSQSVGSIHFESGSARIAQRTYPFLDETAVLLVEDPAIKIRVEGHTDSVGDDETNLSLSEDRAEAVGDYLVGQGVAPGRIETEGYGEGEPVASNSTPKGRAQNRRIEIKVQGAWWKFW